MPDPLDLLHTPTGVPGSGRVRYGAAMALWRDGIICEDVLEVYRIASADDGLDPLPMLALRGLAEPPGLPRPSPLRTLYAQVREYLLALTHPGTAEVARALPQDPGPEQTPSVLANPVAGRWLPAALAALATDRPRLADAIRAASATLDWTPLDRDRASLCGSAFAQGHGYARLRGAGGVFDAGAQDVDLGLLILAPDVLCQDHRHAAPELCVPLTGPHGWRFGTEGPLRQWRAHQPLWTPPLQPRLTKVGPMPFLALCVRTSDTAYRAKSP